MTGLPVAPTPQGTTIGPTAISETIPTSTGVSQIPNGSTGTATVVPSRTAQARTAVIPTVSAGSAGENEQVLEVEADASAVRELKAKEDVTETFITRDQLRTNLIRDIDEDYPQDEAKRDALELWLMRLSEDRDLDLHQLFIDLYTENIAGYYDSEENKLFVLGNQKQLSPQARETLAHEFVHSLQDQHFDLDKLLPEDSQDDDRSLAIRSLVEGDATLAGIMYAYRHFTKEEFEEMLAESSNNPSDVIDRVPVYIRNGLLFPYDAGATFVGNLIEEGGFDRVNKALADPPISSEQILHPDKYLQTPRDEPLPVMIPPLTSTLGTGWTYKDSGTLGEFDFAEILRENGAGAPADSADGWGGGKYDLYQNGNNALLFIDSRWDTASEANEFYNALQETFVAAQPEGDKLWSNGGRYFGLKYSGDRVTLISSTDRKALDNALAAVK
ncbi:MAG: hypothetical protein ABIO92_06980 [Chloroflexia bacterium]